MRNMIILGFEKNEINSNKIIFTFACLRRKESTGFPCYSRGLRLGSFTNDVTVLGGRGQGLCDGSSNALVIISVTMGRGGSKIVPNCVTSFIDDPFLRNFDPRIPILLGLN